MDGVQTQEDREDSTIRQETKNALTQEEMDQLPTEDSPMCMGEICVSCKRSSKLLIWLDRKDNGEMDLHKKCTLCDYIEIVEDAEVSFMDI